VKCPHCNNTELMVNGVSNGLISYVCWNPPCPMHKQAFTATGESTTTLITDQPPEREEIPFAEEVEETI
jgi:hypothetical protein